MLSLLKLITRLLFTVLKLCQPGDVKAVMAVIDQFSRRIVGFAIHAEIKSVPYTPESHPFIERFFRSVRNEFLDHTFFWNSQDLQTKLNQYKSYYNSTRGHWSLNHLTPNQQAECDSTPAIRRQPSWPVGGNYVGRLTAAFR